MKKLMNQQTALEAGYAALDRAADRRQAEYEDRPTAEDTHTEYDMAHQVIGDQLIMWRIEVNDQTGVIDDEIFQTARRRNKADANPSKGILWMGWKDHEDLEDAVDTAITNHQGGRDPDIGEVRSVVAEMTHQWVTTWRRLK